MARTLPRLAPAVLLAAYIGGFGLLLFYPGRGAGFVAVSDIAGILPPLAAGVIAIAAGSTGSGVARPGWLLIGLGCLAWGLGEIIWTWYEVVMGRETPFPSWADAAYLGSAPLLFAGLLVLTAPSSRASRMRTGLDALAVVAAAGALSWHFVLGPIFASTEASTGEKLLTSAYPLSDLALLFALIVVLRRLRSDDAGRVLAVFGAGLLCFLAADTGFAYLETLGTYSTGSLVDLGWIAATALFAYAAHMQYRLRPSYADAREALPASVAWFEVLPILLVPLMVGWPLAQAVFGTPFGKDEAPTLVFIFLFAVSVVLRQTAAMFDTVKLNRRLALSNARLEVRTQVLSERLALEETAANIDWLTGTLSRRAIQQEIDRILVRNHQGLALGLVDLDSLKQINDIEGHSAGDEALRLVATALAIDGAIVGRYGGDEFLVLLPNAGASEVRAYLSIADWRLGNLASHQVVDPPSISSGFALYPNEARTLEGLIELADQRMYSAKNEKKGVGKTGLFRTA